MFKDECEFTFTCDFDLLSISESSIYDGAVAFYIGNECVWNKQDALTKAYSNSGFGSITSNGPATQTKRDPVNISASGYSAWNDSDAIWEMGQSGYSDIVDGDTVTLYDDQQTTTKQYYGGDWWLSFNATFSSGIGTVNCKSVAQPLTGTIEFVEEDTRPGINEEIKEELKSKRLRDW